jgi:hypothetical protein
MKYTDHINSTVNSTVPQQTNTIAVVSKMAATFKYYMYTNYLSDILVYVYCGIYILNENS